MHKIEVFQFDDDTTNFETLGFANGSLTWWASDLMKALGYSSMQSFQNAINRAIAACLTLNIEVLENFIKGERTIEGHKHKDWRLTRFACYLVAMNADIKKPQVAKAQLYFIAIAETFRSCLEEVEKIDRMLIRKDVSDRESSLSGVVKQRGVENYPFFQNAGYRGMYNMNLSALKTFKGLDNCDRSLLDFMGKDELAANLFRITQTELKIKNDNIQGQGRLEAAAESVGRQVRQAMQDISQTRPEDLPLAEDIKEVKKAMKSTHRKFQKLDKPKKNK